MKRYYKYLIFLLIFMVIIIASTFIGNSIIIKSSNDFISDDIEKLKDCKVGLLLGTSKYLHNGNQNDFFFNRIDASVELLNSGKIKYVIISGDNSKTNYNEPLDMKKELLKRGIAENKIYLDYAGFRTFDSVIRAKEIFGQKSVIVISQKFHNERAVYIARKNGIEAFGYNAKEVEAFKGFKTKLREYFARDKMFLDMLFGIKPKYLGDKISIEE